jgi:integrase
MTELKHNPTIISWLDMITSSQNTRTLYLLAMKHYVMFTGMSPDDLLDEAENDIISGKLPRRRRIKGHIIGFAAHIEGMGLSPNTRKSYLTAVRSFYASNDIDLPRTPRNTVGTRTLKENMTVPTVEMIRECLTVCNPLERAVMMCGLSSGMSANELCNLTVRMFKSGYDEDTMVSTIDMRREKVGFDFVTFLSPEASKAVWDYLEYRDRPCNSSRLKDQIPLEKQRVSDDSYLFIPEKIPDEYLKTFDESLRKMRPYGIYAMYRRLSTKSRKDNDKGKWNIVRSHNMRKIFNSRLKNAGCDSDIVEYFMGHTLGATKDAYYKPDIEKLKDIYIRFVPHLLISEDFELKEELKQKDAEYSELRTTIKEMQNDMNSMQVELATIKLANENKKVLGK